MFILQQYVSIIVCIIVIANPIFTTLSSNPVAVTDMDDVRFNCKGEGMPSVTYEWFYQNETGGKNKSFVG